MADRALPDLRTAIKVDSSSLARAEAQVKASGMGMGNSLGAAGKGAKNAEKEIGLLEKRMAASGVETGKLTSLMGGGLTPATLVAAGAAMTLFEAGKSVMEINEKWEHSQELLKQGVEASGWNLGEARKATDKFIDSNRKFVKDQSEVAAGMGAIARAGIDQRLSTQMLNVAMDLSALKHISLEDSIKVVTAAEQGRGKALKELGISMKDYPDLTVAMTQANNKLDAAHKAVTAAQQALTAATKAHGPHSAAAQQATLKLKDAQHKLAEAQAFASDKSKQQQELLDTLATKTKGGRETTSKLEQAQNQLGNAWQDMAHRVGPPLLDIITFIVQKFADFANILGTVFDWIGKIISKVGELVHALGSIKLPDIKLPDVTHPFGLGRAGGGSVVPGNVYDVGELGPEKLIMFPGGGGTILPNSGAPSSGGGPGMINHFYQVAADPADISRELAWLRKTA